MTKKPIGVQIILMMFMLLILSWAAHAGETGMSYDGSGVPGQPPHIAAPGGSAPVKPLSTNVTPTIRSGELTAPGVPLKEIQPGDETPQADTGSGSTGIVRPRATGLTTGDDDDIDDQEVQRLTVQGLEHPGTPARGGAQGLQSSGGDGTQTEDELYVGKKAGETPLDSKGRTPKAAVPGMKNNLPSSGKNLMARPGTAPVEKGPGAVVVPRANCGTYHTGWVDDPEADVNPCPEVCERGERLWVNSQKSGDKTQYDGTYSCYLPELVINQKPEIARQIKAGGVNGTNCGTFWTDRQDNPNVDANPCPANCERGELLDVRRDRSYEGSHAIYQKNYRCYQAGTMNLPAVNNPKPLTNNVPLKTTTPSAGLKGTAPGAGTGSVQTVSGTPQGAQIAGTPTTASTQQGLTEAQRQLKTLPGSTREISTAMLEGVGPGISEFHDITPTSIQVTFESLEGAAGYTLHASAKGLNQTVEGGEIPCPGCTPGGKWAMVSGLAPGVPYDLWLTADYPGGKKGIGEIKSATTTAGINPENAQVTALGPNAVRIEWQPVEGAVEYRIEGDNLPQMRTAETAVAVSNLGAGTHQWTLLSVYPLGTMNDLNPTIVSATLDGQGNVKTGERSRYRVSVLGFRVNEATTDDPLQIDGKGDEVYIAVAVGEYSLPGGEMVKSYPIVPSPVFGDKNGFETASNRVLAGSVGPTGGLRTGDVYPSPDPVNSGRIPTTFDMPYLVWEGELASNENALVITPTIWEWDNNATTQYKYWLSGNNDEYRHTSILPGKLDDPDVLEALKGSAITAINKINDAIGFYRTHFFSGGWFSGAGGDRPIGIKSCQWMEGSIPAAVWLCFADQVWVPLSKDLIDKELAAQRSGTLPVGVLALQFDDESQSVDLPGNYTLYLKVERMP